MLYADALTPKGYATQFPDTPEQARPLTNEVMTRLELTIDSANRIHGHLYELRNRLFGCPPEPPVADGVARSAPSAFTDNFRDRSTDLGNILEAVERLSCELSNRL